MQTVKNRLLAKVSVAQNGCWEWTGGKNRQGYGQIGIGSRKSGGRKTARAHRVSYSEFIGEIPDGHDVCHSCDNPSCINPEHLFIGTESDNMRDMYSKNRHPLPPERCATVKLTREKVMAAKELRRKSGLPYQRIAIMFGVGKKAILDAVKGVTWKCCCENDHEPKEAQKG